MPYDGAVTAAIRAELETQLKNSRVDRVHQPNRDEIDLVMRQPGDSYRLLISAHPNYARVHLTKSTKENPQDALPFCMLLRKHLRGARLLSVSQPDFDRILHFKFETFDEFGQVSSSTLIAEIMGRHSNVMLVDADGIVLDSLKHVTDEQSRIREVLPGRPYSSPPDQGRLDPRSVSQSFFINLSLTGDETKQVAKSLLTNYIGLSPIVCRELALRSGVSPEAQKGSLTQQDAENLWKSFDAVMTDIRTDTYQPCTYTGAGNKVVDFSAFVLGVYTSVGDPKNGVLSESRHESMSEVVDLYYTRKDANERLDQGKSDIRRLLRQNIERCDRKLTLQEDAKREAENAESLKIQGDILMANLWQLKKGQTEAVLPNLYTATQEPIAIQLDPSMTPLENAQKIYRKYSRSKNSIDAVNTQIARTWEEVTYLGQVEVALDNASSPDDVQEVRDELTQMGYIKQAKRQKGKNSRPKQQSIPQPMRFTTADGYEVLVGKNNRQNDHLTMKMAQTQDLWFHTKDIPGSHVILRTGGQNIDELPHSSMIEAARLAAAYSKARNSSNVPVDYCLRRHVRKPPGSKPGMVIYDTQRTIYVDPAQIAD